MPGRRSVRVGRCVTHEAEGGGRERVRCAALPGACIVQLMLFHVAPCVCGTACST